MSEHELLDVTARRLFRRVAVRQSKGRIPSLVEGVVRDGRLVWWGARGSLPEAASGVDVQYRIGSITKTFVAVAVMRLRDEGRLSLDDRVDAHVPGLSFGNRTVAQLLSHTGGVAAELPGSWWERSPGVDGAGLRQAMASGVVVDSPGRAFHYSNVGYAALGELVSRVRGRGWFDVVAAEFLRPLQMNDTTWAPRSPAATGWAVHPYADVVMPEVVQDVGAMGSAGQLWSTVADLGRWAAFLGGDAGGVLSGDTLEEMRAPRAVSDGDAWTRAMGLGVQLWRDRGRRLAGHGGSMPGFQAGLCIDPGSGVGHVALLNCTTAAAVDELEDPFDILEECEP
ncbi:MAG: serine hydrolase domain-containing protein, partial [Stackebrandtia sp.]